MSRSSVTSTNANPLSQGSLPLQLAALLGQSIALYSLTYTIISINFTVLALLLSVAGFFTARHLRKQSNAPALLLPGGVVLIVAFFAIQVFVSRFGRALPFDFVLASTDTSLIVALTSVAALSTFFWVTDTATIFSCVWSIAMSGLAATINLSGTTIVCFAIYLLCALFLLVHHHTLTQAGPKGRHLVVTGSLLALQLRTAALLWLLTFILGVAVAIPLQMVGRNMSLAKVLERLKVSPEAKRLQNAAKLQRVFDNPREFVVGLGPVTDNDTLAYRVTSPRPAYWRIRTFATLMGNQWGPFEADLEGESLSPTRQEGKLNIFTIRPGLEGPRTSTESVTVTVDPIAQMRPMCHLAEPKELRTENPTLVRRIDGTIGMMRSQLDFAPPPTAYTLVADVSVATPEELNASSQTYPKEVTDRYFQEPDPGRLDELARQAIETVKDKGPFDKAEAIRRFVANRCTYSLEAPACPPGRNPAEWFLNESKVGYCDLYATAVTMLCRAASIPARVATGFNAGEIDADHPNSYNLRERNRHAWCEVFFTGYGWIPFDATALTAEATSAPVASPPLQKAKLVALPSGPAMLAGVALLGLLGVGTTELLRRRGVLPGRDSISPEAIFARRVLTTYRAALHQLKRQGVARESSMTVGEHVELVQRRLGSTVARAYERLARLSERTLFSQQATPEGDVTLAQQALSELRTALKERTH